MDETEAARVNREKDINNCISQVYFNLAIYYICMNGIDIEYGQKFYWVPLAFIIYSCYYLWLAR